MPLPVIALFRPLDGKTDELMAVLRDHLGALRELGLATDWGPHILRSADGTLLEIFEWVDQAAVDKAHDDPIVRTLWDRFEDCCTYATLGSLPEAAGMFPHFDRLTADEGGLA